MIAILLNNVKGSVSRDFLSLFWVKNLGLISTGKKGIGNFFYKMSNKTIVPEVVVDYPDMRRCVVVD